MTKVVPSKPTIICLYGYPGSGKSYLARNLANDIQLANISSDRIRSELFQTPRYDSQENAIITHLMDFICDEFLNTGTSVIYDVNALRLAQRRKIRELARKHRAEFLLIWLQIDINSAYERTQERDRRTMDDKYAEPQTKNTFDSQVNGMQNPDGEDYLVVSGKHTYTTQKNAIMNRFYQMGLIGSNTVQIGVAKPGLVNLIPNLAAGRVDMSRRNININ